MIHQVSADRPSFRTTYFKPGFNVILAERTKESTKRDSRNGLGKSALIEIIHFCLGGTRGETLKKSALDDWVFTLDIDLGENRYRISRNTSKPGRIFVDGDCSDWPVKHDTDSSTGNQVISNEQWKRILGQLMFGLKPDASDLKYQPTFRSLISYFIRRNGHTGAFLNPFQQFKNQLEWDIQVNNTFLLDLGWEYASRWQILKDKAKLLDQIRQEIKTGTLSSIMDSVGVLDARRIRLKSQIEEQEARLKDFKVFPQYQEIQNEANSLTRQIHELINKNITESQLLEHYEASLQDEVDVGADLLTKLYEEAGVVFKDSVTKRLDEVVSFHREIVTNRRSFLTSEIVRLRDSIANREEQEQRFIEKRAELLQILNTHGALEEYTDLQTYHQTLVAELRDIEHQMQNLTRLEQGRSSIIVDQELLRQQAKTDLTERASQKELAVLQFNRNSEFLYEAPGTLSIDISKFGYKFDVSIERSASHGIGNMKIFCYDLMLAQIWATRDPSPGFLVHDSILFADVDERQVALALQLAALESEKMGFQYICTLNSDTVPYDDFENGFDFEGRVNQILTDATENGTLFGLRF